MADFTDILSKKADEIEKPKPRPSGTYQGSTVGFPKQKSPKVDGAERAVLSFSVKMIAAREDVDEEKLAEAGDIANWPTMNYDIWIDTPEGEWALTRFLEDVLGIEMAGKSLGEGVAESAGKQALWSIEHKPGKDRNTGEPTIFANITKAAAL